MHSLLNLMHVRIISIELYYMYWFHPYSLGVLCKSSHLTGAFQNSVRIVL